MRIETPKANNNVTSFRDCSHPLPAFGFSSSSSLPQDMYKNQLQELAQRSCFNLPYYAFIREGPDHAPRFKASVNFNGEIFSSPSYSSTLRQAEHAAAEVALNLLSSRGPSRSLTARVLDETGVYKNLLQETAHRAGLNLPVYTTVRSGPGHVPVFTCTVQLGGINFKGDSAKTKKQAEKNAAIAAWSTLKKMPNLGLSTIKEEESRDEQEEAAVTRVLSNLRPNEEAKQIRRKDPTQGRRKMVKGRDNGSSSSSLPINSLHCQQSKLLDLLMDMMSPETSTQKQKQNCFTSLLPPPPPPTVSRILPLNSVKALAFEEHRTDEEEWLSSIADGTPTQTDKAHFVYKGFARNMYTGGFRPHRVAPPVQIRSVIPVFAAQPPVRSEASTNPAIEVKKTTSLNSGTEAEGSSASLMMKTPLLLNSSKLQPQLENLQLCNGK